MMHPSRTARDLRVVDRYGGRDDGWLDGFGLAREALDVLGRRCLTCGRRLYTGQGRIYCNTECRRRQIKRRDRFRTFLRESGRACPYCHGEP